MGCWSGWEYGEGLRFGWDTYRAALTQVRIASIPQIPPNSTPNWLSSVSSLVKCSWRLCAKTNCLCANVIPARHNGHVNSTFRTSPSNQCLDPQQLSYEHYNESAHLSKRHRTSAIDGDSLYSTNNFWGFENPEVEHFNPDYTLATNPAPNHSAQYPGAIHDAIGFGYDDSANHGGVGPVIPLHESHSKLTVGYGDPLPLLSGFENTSLSTSTFGNLESVSNTHVDVNASFDYGNGQYDLSGFSFDDYLISMPDFVSIIGGVEVEHASSPSSSTHQSLQAQTSPNSSLSPSSLGSESSEGGLPSPGSLASSAGSSVHPPIAKLEITPALSFECSRCHRTFTCESRYKWV